MVSVLRTPACERVTDVMGFQYPLHPKVGTHGACGTILPAATVKIVKLDGTLASKGTPGELFVKGDLVTLGYYGNPEA